MSRWSSEDPAVQLRLQNAISQAERLNRRGPVSNSQYMRRFPMEQRGPEGRVIIPGWTRRWGGFFDKLKLAGTVGKWSAGLGGAYGVDVALWGSADTKRNETRRSRGPASTTYSPGTYNAADVPWRGSGGWARNPKGWDKPDQPWPTADDSTAGGGAGGAKPKTHFNSKVRYEKY